MPDPLLALEGVSLAFAGITVLQNVNFAVQPGSIASLLIF